MFFNYTRKWEVHSGLINFVFTLLFLASLEPGRIIFNTFGSWLV